MNESRRRKLPLDLSKLPIDYSGVRFDHDHESHGMTLNRPNPETGWATESLTLSIEYHLTARITNSSLTRKQLSLLLEVLNYQAVAFGVNLNMQLAIYEIYFRLLGSKPESGEVRESYIRKTILVSEIILKSLKDEEMSLYSQEFIEIKKPIKELLKPYLMSKRTYKSRFSHYRPEKLIVIKAVPVDTLFVQRQKNSEPYSSYCKGYGESHPSAHKEVTKPNFELDGSGESPADQEENFLFRKCTDPIHNLSNFLLIKYELLTEEE